MKLNNLYEPFKRNNEYKNYMRKLTNLYESYVKSNRLLSEAKITITIDDDNNNYKVGLPPNIKNDFIAKAKAIGDFDNKEWVDNLIKSMEQAGVQGFNKICERDTPVTSSQIKQLIELLIELINAN